jgi:5-hydroxyisourate hydrolase-like protein (transthyretin family)
VALELIARSGSSPKVFFSELKGGWYILKAASEGEVSEVRIDSKGRVVGVSVHPKHAEALGFHLLVFSAGKYYPDREVEKM